MSDFQISYFPMYDPEAVQPMRDELVAVGFDELLTPEDVDAALGVKNDQTIFVFINSVCGCAGGSARPGATLALQHKTIPDRFVTVFAGQERPAVDQVRQVYLKDFPPSSPSMALLKNGEVLYMMHRHDIEGRRAEDIAAILTQVFDEFCSAEGPSIPPEDYAKIVHARMCGSKIPRFGR